MELMHEEEKEGAVHHFSSLQSLEIRSMQRPYHPFEIYISLGVLYFVMTYSMTFVARKLERKATKWQ